MTPLTTLLVACMPQIVRLLIETHSTGRRHSAVFALGNFTPRHSEITGIIIVIILRRIRVHSCVVCMHKSTRYAPAGYTRTLVVSSSSVTFAQFPHINAAFNALHEYVRELTSLAHESKMPAPHQRVDVRKITVPLLFVVNRCLSGYFGSCLPSQSHPRVICRPILVLFFVFSGASNAHDRTEIHDISSIM